MEAISNASKAKGTANRESLMKDGSPDVGTRSQTGIPHDIEIGETRQTQSIAEAAAPRAFDIEQNFDGFADLKARVQGQQA